MPVFDDDGRFREWVGTLTDVTERRLARLNREFLASLEERVRILSDSNEIEQTTIRRLGEYLDAARCNFASLDLQRDECAVEREWRREVPTAVGTYRWSE